MWSLSFSGPWTRRLCMNKNYCTSKRNVDFFISSYQKIVRDRLITSYLGFKDNWISTINDILGHGSGSRRNTKREISMKGSICLSSYQNQESIFDYNLSFKIYFFISYYHLLVIALCRYVLPSPSKLQWECPSIRTVELTE